MLAGEQLQMCDSHVDGGCHRRDIARGLRQQIAALDGRHERRSQLGNVGVPRNHTFALKPVKKIFEKLLPRHEQLVELPASDRILIGDLVRQ